MKVDVGRAERTNYDLCIIGTGPAGIILALEYQKLRPQHLVLLIEYGAGRSVSKNSLDDSINIKTPENHHLPYECTNKGLGGSSATWGGRCVMYDEVDFLPRKILGGQCTWNLALLNESRQYAGPAAKYFECGGPQFDLNEIPTFAGSHIAEGFESGEVTDSVIERWSMPTRFGERYGSQIDSSETLHLLVGWEASELNTSLESGTISEVGLRDFSRLRYARIMARKFIIAAGTQETTRLLLKNRQVFKQRGAPPDSLGKYYQGHVSGKIASVQFYGDPQKTEYGFLHTPEGVYLRRRLQLSTQAIIDNDLLNTALWLDNPLYVDPEHRNGAMSFMYLAMITPFLG